jgi:protein phosphatase 1 regulatory subunit 7
MLDGVDIMAEEKVKAENLHGVDNNDRQTIFTSLLPEEQFVDRRMQMIEELEVESDDPDSEDLSQFLTRKENNSSHVQSSVGSGSSIARRYVGELIQRVEYGQNTFTANFVM